MEFSSSILDKVPFDVIEQEQKFIEDQYLNLRAQQKFRRETIACFKRCGGKVTYPFVLVPDMIVGKNYICFGDCLNINFEKGPYLHEYGQVPQDAIPKKFIWPTSFD